MMKDQRTSIDNNHDDDKEYNFYAQDRESLSRFVIITTKDFYDCDYIICGSRKIMQNLPL